MAIGMTGYLVGFRGLVVALSAGALWGCGGEYSLGRAEPEPDDGGAAGATDVGTGGTGKAGAGGSAGKAAGGQPGAGGSGGSAGTNTSGDGGDDPGGAPGAGGTNGGMSGSSGRGGTSGFAGWAGSGGTPTTASPITRIRTTATDKIDLLFMIDNSISMADKQQIMADAVPVLLERLIRPRCIDENGNPTGGVISTSGDCATGAPEFPPVQDIHVGIITSSLGHHGSHDVCSDSTGDRTPDDKAQLLGSVRSGVPGNESGFLSWQPGDDIDTLAANFADQVHAAGEYGCGYEAQLESWYRFLVDPEPVDAMDNDDVNSVRVGTNNTVLAQRAEFLRPDSLLAIIMLTDENDCSIIDENDTQGWLTAYKGGPTTNIWRMPASTQSCKDNPNDRCCRPCVVPPAQGCGDNAAEGCPDAGGSGGAGSLGGYLSIADDSMNQRCFRQKERFGIDLLYPTSRYVSALRDTMIAPRNDGRLVQNPLFAPSGYFPGRARDMVYLGGIVGVPWQDLATAESLEDPRKLEYFSARDLWENNRWGLILGDPASNTDPSDPLMIESIDPRPAGAQHPIVLDGAIAAPGSAGLPNVINGREQAVDPAVRDDLQFACIFPMTEPVACTASNTAGCDCNADEAIKNSPLCQFESPNEDGTQIYAKAYPGLRELEVLKGVGDQALVASICPKNTTAEGDPAADPDFGYNPAVSGLLSRLREGIGPSCIERDLPVESTESGEQTTCAVVEAHRDDVCVCEASLGRLTVAPGSATETSVLAQLQADGQCGGSSGASCDSYCLCEIQQLSDADLEACQNDEQVPNDAFGFCFIDGSSESVNPNLVRSCPGYAKRALRFAGDGAVTPGAFALLSCPEE